jgi:hypothetical protein
MHWIGHFLGLDDASGPFYLFWSGVCGGLGPFAAGFAIVRRHNCHRRGCWRIGRFSFGERFYCRLHHPHKDPDGPAEAS